MKLRSQELGCEGPETDLAGWYTHLSILNTQFFCIDLYIKLHWYNQFYQLQFS